MPQRDRALIYPFDIRLNPHAAPSVGIFDSPTVPLCINREWAKHISGVIARLLRTDAWVGEFDEQYAATQEVMKFLVTFQEGMFCMTDFCCDETNESLQVLITNQNTLITNIVTLINNSTTIIDQNDTTILNQVITQYQTSIANNYSMSITNQMLYDGTPQSIAPNLGETFATGDSEENALCQALKRYMEWQCYVGGVQAGNAASIGGALAAAFIALAPFTAGVSVVAGLVAAAAGFTFAQIQAAYSDNQALRKVLCCVFDYLKGQSITEEVFQGMVDSCSDWGFYSHEYIIASQISNASAYYHENYLAFIRMLGESQGNGNRADCDCCDEIEDYEIVGEGGTIVTQVSDFQWRLQVTTGTLGGGDPTCGGFLYFNAIFHERENRTINVIGASGTAMASYWQKDDHGNIAEGAGGGGGQAVLFQWTTKACPPDPTTLDITITIACPILEFVP